MSRPLLIYDGECGFCFYCVRYARRITRGQVAYAPYQRVAGDFPDIDTAAFAASIQLIEDGRRSAGAEAAFRTLAYAGGWCRIWAALYRRLPGFAALTELLYRFVSGHRRACHRVSKVLWGRELHPASYALTTQVYLRLLALVYLAAFISFAVQAKALIGVNGILPAAEFLDAVHAHYGAIGWWKVPTLFWLSSSDAAIGAVAWGGALVSVVLLLGRFERTCLLLLYLLYLSLVGAGQVFMGYQWDSFLLEVGFLAIVLKLHAGTGVWLHRWLLFRFMFLSGAVKLLSGDANWAGLAALDFHYETQPLPTLLAWYAHHLPEWFQRLSVGVTFVIELVLPFFIFMPRRQRQLALAGFVLLETVILLTGNYNFFNLLTLALCLLLADDQALMRVLPRARRLLRVCTRRVRTPVSWPATAVAGALAALAIVLGTVTLTETFGMRAPRVLHALDGTRIVNRYGLFAVMTTLRNEIVLEGSRDGVEWREYTFRYKPGDVQRAPGWLIPHQPRVDWQMWFAALGDLRSNYWLQSMVLHLLEGTPQVQALLGPNPFPDAPPRWIRARFYNYRFTDAHTRRRTGAWWTREPIGLYMPSVSLEDFRR